MAQIVTITNPLTGQPEQVDQLEHTAQQIDDGIGFESTDYPGCYYRMVGGVVEWLNSPMILGVEYRTTERYLGKPVYVKLVDVGTLKDGSSSAVTVYKYGVAPGATGIVDYRILYSYNPDTVTFNTMDDFINTSGAIQARGSVNNSPAGSGTYNGAYIAIICFANLTSYSAKCMFKYIKE